MDGTSVFTVVLVVVLVFGAIYLMDPTLFGLLGPKMMAMPPTGSGSANGGSMSREQFSASLSGMGVTGNLGGNLEMGGNLGAVLGETNGYGGNVTADVTGGASGQMGVAVEPFQNNASAGAEQAAAATGNPNVANGSTDVNAYEGPAQFGNAEAPAGCYPRDQLTPSELLPKDPNSVWAQQNPMGVGSLKGKNFLSAGALIGVNTVGQSMRNANLQLRSEPPNPQMPVSIFNVPTIEPDINRRPLEIG